MRISDWSSDVCSSDLTYAPYSGFHVGAALLLRNGYVVTGANVENASYGLTLCAETAAVAKIANEGWIGELAEVAIVGGRPDGDALTGSEPVTPCGRCRQILNEAAARSETDIPVHCASGDGSAVKTKTAGPREGKECGR